MMIRVLFVDDEMIARVAYNSIVNWEKTEFKIVGAVCDGKAALDAIYENNVQIVVTDLKMPNMDGIELAKELYKRNYQGQVIILTCYSEFELARQALRYGVSDYLLKASFTADSLLETLRHAAKKLPQDHKEEDSMPSPLFCPEEIHKIIYGPDEGVDISKEQLPEKYSALYIFTKEILHRNSESYGKKSISSEMFSSLVRECLSTKGIVVPLSGKSAVVLLREKYSKAYLENEILKIKNSVNIYMNTEVGFVQSETFWLREQMRCYLRKCLDTSILTLYYGFGVLLHQNDIDDFTNEPDIEDYEEIIYICKAILASRYNDAIYGIDLVFKSLIEKKIKVDKAHVFIKKLFESLAISCGFYFEENNKDLQQFCQSYKNEVTVENYKKIAKDFIDKIRKNPIKNTNKNYRYEVEKIISYINSNLQGKISLNELADFVNLTESYISKLFKNETGINLMCYVNMLKMEKAMNYLLDPNVMVKEVANKLGYDEQSYFNRTFNKYFGYSPSEVRTNFANFYKN